MLELRNQNLEHAHVVQPAERRRDLRGVGEEGQESLVRHAIGLAGKSGHRGADSLPGVTGDGHLVEHREFGEPDDLPHAAGHPRQAG